MSALVLTGLENRDGGETVRVFFSLNTIFESVTRRRTRRKSFDDVPAPPKINCRRGLSR